MTGDSAYKVEIEAGGRAIAGLVPEDLMGEPPLGAPRHQPAYEWLSRNERKIADALVARAEGREPPAPFDRVTLWEEC